MIVEAATFWFVLFSGPTGTAPADMDPQTGVGPFPLAQCYAVGSTLTKDLADMNPGTAFAGSCSRDLIFEKQPGVAILTAGQLVEAFEEVKEGAGQ